MADLAVALVPQLGIKQCPGLVADGTQADDPRTLRAVELVMHVDHFGTFGAMHPPMVKAVAAGLGATGGRHRRALRALVGDRRTVHV
ncbi:MAG: hypothetical protein WAQ05_05430, partial [Rubrivivax sp.]